MEETKHSAPSLYLNISDAASRNISFSKQYISDKIPSNNKFYNNITIIKLIRNYHETEVVIYNKK